MRVRVRVRWSVYAARVLYLLPMSACVAFDIYSSSGLPLVRECVYLYECVHGDQYVHCAVYLSHGSACACTCTVLGVGSLSGTPIVRECIYVYVFSVRRVQPERCTYCT